MAQHQEHCDICERIKQCENGTHPGLICETETGWAVMGDSQYFRGYCLLLCKTPATELDELPQWTRWKYLQEMSLLAEAVRKVLNPHKLNYECLGNQVHHLHWHIFPRRADETDVLKPVWTCMPASENAAQYAFNEKQHGALRDTIRTELLKLLNQP